LLVFPKLNPVFNTEEESEGEVNDDVDVDDRVEEIPEPTVVVVPNP
jgi:hypothetical protein